MREFTLAGYESFVLGCLMLGLFSRVELLLIAILSD